MKQYHYVIGKIISFEKNHKMGIFPAIYGNFRKMQLFHCAEWKKNNRDIIHLSASLELRIITENAHIGVFHHSFMLILD